MSKFLEGRYFSKVKERLTAPDIVGQKAEFIQRGTEAKAKRNVAQPSVAATVIGTPIYSPYSTRLTGGSTYGDNQIDTGISPSDVSQTFVAVANVPRLSDGDLGAACVAATTNYGFYFANGLLRYAGGGNSTTLHNIALAPFSTAEDSYYIAIGTSTVGGPVTMWMSNGAGGLTKLVGTGASPGRGSTGSIRLGGSNLGNGRFQLADAQYFARECNDVWAAAINLRLLNYYADKIVIK